MIERILEPEVMDTEEDAREYAEMDHDEPNRWFVEGLLASGPIESDVLDLGTGPAQLAVLVAQALPAVHLWGLDMSAEMLDLGQANVVLADLVDRVHLWIADAKALPYADGRFRTVISNSLIHHIPDPIAVLREAWRVTAPGGRVFIRDLMRPGDETALRQLVVAHAGTCTPRQQQLFEESLHAALTLDEIRALVAQVGARPETVAATSDRHWTWVAVKP
ncbi:MAG: class I SAM-dependent methyltransferase [Pirellulales bacterium]|nr:class I SAM-dependent methyltransferase [Pirellulales bacterium]